MKSLFIISVIVLLTSCGTVEHSVKVSDEQAFTKTTRVIVGTVTNATEENFDVDIETMFREALIGALEKESMLDMAGGSSAMTMNASIIEYRKGDAFKRWLWPGYGSTVLVVECTLVDSEGNVDAVAQANRSVDAGGGFTIGAWKSIFDDVAADLVSDLKQQMGK